MTRTAEPARPPGNPRHGKGRRACAGFTLAEVLAALVFMAIVIPVAMEGVQVASRASVLGQRKAVATRIAERVLNELVVTGQAQMGTQGGVIPEGSTLYHWTVRFDLWNQNPTAVQFVSMQLMTVQVTFPVQGHDYTVGLSTLVSTGTLQ